MMSSRHLSVCCLTTAMILCGCRDRQIQTYRIPKEPMPSLPAASGMGMGGMPGGEAGQAAPSALAWTAPDAWEVKPGSAMRKGSFAVKGDNGKVADLSVISFPGDAGGEAANLNRWRGQLGLPAQSDEEVMAATEHLDVGEYHFTVVDYTGTSAGAPARMLGALVPANGETYFFKLLGPETVVGDHKDEFIAFLKSVHTALPGMAQMNNMAAELAPPSTDSALGWTAPDNWKVKPASAMRKGSFNIEGDNGETGDLSVISFPGDAGGLAANLNRWRGQLGLAPQSEAEVVAASEHLDVGDLHLTVVDYTGIAAGVPSRLLGALVPVKGETYFFKLLGPEAVVGAHKDEFIAFLKTVHLR